MKSVSKRHPARSALIAAAGSVIGIVALVSFASKAETITANAYADVAAKLTEALSTFVGQPISLDGVRKSKAKGIVEVQITNGPMIYATEDGDHFFLQGDLHTYRGGEVVNLTEEGRVDERLALMNEVKLDDMIIFSPKGETADYINVFTDVSCGYCQKLHREVADLNGYGIEVRYLAYPRSGIDSDGARELETAWCADDPQATLTKLKTGTNVPKISCNPDLIAAQFNLGNRLGVRGTPAIVTSDGRLIPGYQPAANIAKLLGLN